MRFVLIPRDPQEPSSAADRNPCPQPGRPSCARVGQAPVKLLSSSFARVRPGDQPLNSKGEDLMRSVLSNFVPLAASSAQRLAGLLIIPALSLALHSAPAFAANDVCSDATLVGSYGFTIQGFQPNLDGTTSPIKGIAITVFD